MTKQQWCGNEKAKEILVRVLGESHPDTAAACQKLTDACRWKEEPAKAVERLTQAMTE